MGYYLLLLPGVVVMNDLEPGPGSDQILQRDRHAGHRCRELVGGTTANYTQLVHNEVKGRRAKLARSMAWSKSRQQELEMILPHIPSSGVRIQNP